MRLEDMLLGGLVVAVGFMLFGGRGELMMPYSAYAEWPYPIVDWSYVGASAAYPIHRTAHPIYGGGGYVGGGAHFHGAAHGRGR